MKCLAFWHCPERILYNSLNCFYLTIILCLSLLVLPKVSFAENISYDGSDPSVLQDTPDWLTTPKSLFPGTKDSPNLSGNIINITGGTIDGSVAAGVSPDAQKNAETTNNKIYLTGGTVQKKIYGGASETGNSSYHEIYINGGTVKDEVFGAYIKDGPGNAYGNIIQMNGGAVEGLVGGQITHGDGSAYNNTIIVTAGKVGEYTHSDIVGGYIEDGGSGHVYNNTIVIDDGEIFGSSIGGRIWFGSGNAYNNHVIVKGTSTLGDQSLWEGGVQGGRAYTGDAIANTVTITDNAQTTSLYGGTSRYGNARGNIVYILNGTVGDGIPENSRVFGGRIYRGFNNFADGNMVLISGGTIGNGDPDSAVYGAHIYKEGGSAINNLVAITGGIVNQNVYGAYLHEGTGYTRNNKVYITDGVVTGKIYGGWSNSNKAVGNSIFISNTATVEDAYGGYVSLADDNAEYNHIDISGGTSNAIYGGFIADGSGNALQNTISIRGGVIADNIYAGYVKDGSGNAESNSISISKGTINGDIYGGYIENGTGNATGNNIILSGDPLFNPTTNILGGDGLGSGDYFSKNSLLVLNHINSPTGNLQNFQFYRFLLPNTAGSNIPMLTTTDLNLTDGASRTSTVDWLAMPGGGTVSRPGDSFVLLRSTNPITGNYIPNRIAALKGIAVLYDMQVEQQGNDITAQIVSAGANPRAKALSEGRVSALAFLNQGTDLIADPLTTAGTHIRQSNLVTFGAMNGSTSRYKTGSHSDLDGFSILTGLGWNTQLQDSKLLLGTFFEAGWGTYDSHNSFSAMASVSGSGDTEYYGAGILGRYEVNNGVYAEGSFRAGRVKTDFHSGDLTDYAGTQAAYDSSSSYYGAHAGAGYIWELTDNTTLDVFSKYLWTRQGSDTVNIVGDPIKFKASDSHRWRNGVRLTHEIEKESGLTVSPYVGASFDYEFDGKAKATVYGYNLLTPDISGGTGIIELGTTIIPSNNSNLKVDLGMQGYIGQREGVSGSFSLKYSF